MRRAPTPAEAARIAAGYSLEAVARYLRTSPAAIRRLERAGSGWSYLRAEKLAHLYRCSLDAFPGPGVGKRFRERKP